MRFFFLFIFFLGIQTELLHAEFDDPCKEDSSEFHDPVPKEPFDTSENGPFGKFVNLEKKAQDFIIETKEIIIPGFPNAFNPSVVRWQDKILLCFRIRTTKTTHQIGFIWVDENFEPVSDPYPLFLPQNPITNFCKQQDPRLIVVGNHLYMIYSNIIPGLKFQFPQVRRVFITEVHFDGLHFFANTPECLRIFEGENEARWEKNWTPFVYKEELLLSYSINPHRIFRITGKESCETIASSSCLIQWNWGHLRGGTCAALLNDEEYLVFFHSSKSMKTVHSKGKEFPHYFMGAFTYAAEPPFNITQISPEPIIGYDFYTSAPYKTWKPLRVVFPGGFIMDDQYIWVVYGKQDFESWVVKIDKKGLLDNLVPVKAISK